MTAFNTASRSQPLKWDAVQLAVAILVFIQVWRIQDLFPTLAIPGAPVLATCGAMLLLVLDRQSQRRLSGLNQPVVRTACAIVLLVALSIPGSLYPGKSMSFLLKEYVRTVILMLLVAASVRDLPDLRRLAWLQIAGVTLFSCVVLARADLGSEGRLDAASFFYDANDLAMLIVCTLPLVLFLWRRPARRVERALLVAATVLLMMTFGQTGSRGGFLGFVAVAGYLLLRMQSISRAKRAGAVAVLAILLVALASDRYFDRIQTILHPSTDYNWQGKSETGRMDIWRRGIGYMLSNPALGVGANAFGVAEGKLSLEARQRQRYGIGFQWSTAHNSFIQIGAELGIPGLILFVTLLVGAFRTLSRIRGWAGAETGVLAQTLTGSLVAFLVTAIFLSQAYSAYLYTLLGMIVGLARMAPPVGGRGLQTRFGLGGHVLWPKQALAAYRPTGGVHRAVR